jgi:ACS family glucarate transporter-like MFS transporter
MWACTRWGGAATPPLALLCITVVRLALGLRDASQRFGLVWCLVSFLLWYKDDPAHHPGVNSAEMKLLEASRALTTHRVGQRHWISLLLTRQVFALGLQYFCFSYVWYFYITWLPTYLREGRGQSPARAAALAVLPLLFGGFGSLATGLAPRIRCSRVEL